MSTGQRCHTVLVADDEADLRLLVEVWLERAQGFTMVAAVASGGEAIEAANRLQPDVVVMDLRMANGDGEEATKIIRSLCAGTNVLVYTALSDIHRVGSLLDAGAIGYLVKSGCESDFVEALSAVADGHGYLSEELEAKLPARDQSGPGRSPIAKLQRERDLGLVERALAPGAIRIAHQDIVDLTTGVVVGREALARFDHTAGPGAVFDAAHRLGRSEEVELAAARAAVESALLRSERDTFTAINASPQTVLSASFRAAIDRMSPTRLVVELTERFAVADYRVLADALLPLRAQGVRLAIDDVGSGFASLNHVRKLRPDIIKIDRDLVCGVDGDHVGQAIVTALVGIADSIGARTVGEGIETEVELECLLRCGVGLGQGFHTGRPSIPSMMPNLVNEIR